MNSIQETINEINNQIDEVRTIRMSLQPHQVKLDNVLHEHMSNLHKELEAISH